MKSHQIAAGRTYVGKGKDKVRRFVSSISEKHYEHGVPWVWFHENHLVKNMSLTHFAQWAKVQLPATADELRYWRP